MNIRIVCYEDVNSWILGKFALKMQEHLTILGSEVSISKSTDINADINHHIIYENYSGIVSNNDTMMITHIDSNQKISHLKNTISSAKLGICMSKDTMLKLTLLGLPAEKLCYVNPAHDGDFTPKKIQVGFASRWYDDGRKREFLLKDLINHLDNRFFAFKIIGQGWEFIVELMKKKGFDVIYFPEFDLNAYKKTMSEIDYYLYTGLDEGQMGFVDALASGVKTIVTPQGYHLDAKGGITHQFISSNELIDVFDSIYFEKIRLIKSVEDWTWKNYSIKHLELWCNLLGNKIVIDTQTKYCDGIYSIYTKNDETNQNSVYTYKLRWQILISGLKRFYFRWTKIILSKKFWDRQKSKIFSFTKI
jgi:hypothetical protein